VISLLAGTAFLAEAWSLQKATEALGKKTLNVEGRGSHMKILVVHNFYRQPGGEDVVFEAERALLERHGHEVVTFRGEQRSAGWRQPTESGLKAI
jgi:hypothetical protein